MLAFISACVAHEAVGHGGACLATGGQITLLTTVYFHCRPGSTLIDIAGPVMNLVMAGIAWRVVSRTSLSVWVGLLAAFAFAFNALWGVGYLIYSAALDIGDWAPVFRDLQGAAYWVVRIGIGLAGLWLYRLAVQAIAPRLPSKIPLLIGYGSAVAIATLSVLCARTPILPALREALQESLVASVGLLLLAFKSDRTRVADGELAAKTPANWLVIAGVPVIIAFLLLQGRGFGAV
jgi:putative Ca2+/H+ antiporter (TMEM165/GDT1 family)